MAAVAAGLDMAAERRRAAQLDGAHDARLDTAKRAAGRTSPFPAIGRTMAAEHIRHLQRATHAAAQAGGVTARSRRSSGLRVLAIVEVAT